MSRSTLIFTFPETGRIATRLRSVGLKAYDLVFFSVMLCLLFYVFDRRFTNLNFI